MSKEKILEEYKKIPLPIYFQAYNKEAQSELVKFSKEVIQPFLEQALTSYTEELKKKIEGKKRYCHESNCFLTEDSCKCKEEHKRNIIISECVSELNHQ